MTTTRIIGCSLIPAGHLTYTLEQYRLVEGLLQEEEVRSKNILCLQHRLGVAGHEEDPYIGPHLSHLLCHGWTLHLRHDHIRQKEIDWRDTGRSELYGL